MSAFAVGAGASSVVGRAASPHAGPSGVFAQIYRVDLPVVERHRGASFLVCRSRSRTTPPGATQEVLTDGPAVQVAALEAGSYTVTAA
jgi:hypothetical protein